MSSFDGLCFRAEGSSACGEISIIRWYVRSHTWVECLLSFAKNDDILLLPRGRTLWSGCLLELSKRAASLSSLCATGCEQETVVFGTNRKDARLAHSLSSLTGRE